MVYYFIKANVFGEGGLAEDVLYFSISNAIIPPVLRIVDPGYGIWMVRKWWYSRPGKEWMRFRKEIDELDAAGV